MPVLLQRHHLYMLKVLWPEGSLSGSLPLTLLPTQSPSQAEESLCTQESSSTLT